MIYLIGLGVISVIGICGIVYLTFAIGRFGLIRKIAGEKKWMRHLICLSLIAGCFALFTVLLSVFDAVIVLLHVLFFFLISGMVMRIVQRISKKQPKVFWQGWLALATAGVYLAVGYIQCVHVWKTEYALTTDKAVGSLRIAVIADSHLGTTFDGQGFASYIDEVMRHEPDILLIPGDFVDDDTKRVDMLAACAALGNVNPPYGVWFAYGNHDKGYFNSRDFTAAELAQALQENGVHILENEIAYAGDLCIAGRRDASLGPRSELKSLLNGADTDKFVIVLDHQPTDYEKESQTNADLVVSGHTHGGQMIPLGLIGRWFGGNDRTYGYEKRNGTHFIVTSGISDWAVHFKTGARSEYVIITVTGIGS